MYTKDRHETHTADKRSDTYRASETADAVLQESWETLQEKTTDFQENIISYIQENPIKSIGFAAIAGMILVQLLKK